MEAELQTQVAFHLTGRRPATGLDAVDALELRPALLARYRDLSALRYDFPVVLVANPAAGPCAQPLSGLLDSVLLEIADGDDGDRVSRHVLRLERAIRALLAEGVRGTLSSLWDTAASRLSVRTDELLQDSLKRARTALCARPQAPAFAPVSGVCWRCVPVRARPRGITRGRAVIDRKRAHCLTTWLRASPIRYCAPHSRRIRRSRKQGADHEHAETR